MRAWQLGAVLTAGAIVGGGQAPATVRRPVILELFTSEGCSSCPPADALLRELSSRPDVLAFGFHVTYWNYLGWRDPFSFDGATDRQRAYGANLNGTVYTPQLVVDGLDDVVGSDRAATLAAIRHAAAMPGDAISVAVRRSGDDAEVTVGGGVGQAHVLIVGYDPERTTAVGRGENGGRTLVEANIVRGIERMAEWSGAPLTARHARPPGERLAVIVQAADGRIVGAAREVDGRIVGAAGKADDAT